MKWSDKVEAIINQIITIRRTLHSHPELSFCEHETSRLVANVLEEAGIEVTTGVGGTGVVGLIKGEYPGNTLAIRADMDALPIEENTGLEFASQNPGVMHACGHDMHTAIVLGAAILLSGCRDQMRGNIKFIFQPAEEIGAGALKMVEEGVLENPAVDAIIALHCWPEIPVGSIGVKRGTAMAAMDTLEVTIMGSGGHAAHPHKCVDAIVIAGQVISALQTVVSREISPVDSAVITIGKIRGGTASNIIASHVELLGTVRTVNPDTREKMPEMIQRIIGQTAQSMNGDSEVRYHFGTPPLINDDRLADLVYNVANDLLGEDRFVNREYASMGGEDFAVYMEKVPGLMFLLGTANHERQTQLPNHHAKLIYDEKAIAVGMTVLCETAMRFLSRDM